MTDAPQGRAQQFFAAVLPALKTAGYAGYGSQQRLADETGMSPGTVSRLMRGKTIPDIQFFPAIAKVTGVPPLELLVLAGVFPEDTAEHQRTLSETEQSQVGSERITPEAAADRLGFRDEVRRAIFLGFVDSLKHAKPESSDASGEDAAAQM